MESCSRGLKRVTLELGGNDAAVVFPDVDVASTATAIAQTCLFNTSQVCLTIKRIYVHTDIYPQFLQAFCAVVESFKPGDGFAEGALLGPIQNETQFKKIQNMVSEVRSANLKIVSGSTSSATTGKGYFIAPVVVDNPPDDAPVVTQEPFGPIIPLLTWSDEEDVIQRANDSKLGLGASVWTQDLDHGAKAETGGRGGGMVFQLYVPKVKKDAEGLILKAKELGFDALAVTVDAPVIGKRDVDDRFKALLDYEAGVVAQDSVTHPPFPGEEAETLRGHHCSSFEWSDIPWIRGLWGDRPIILKGIQTWEDALEATKYGVDGIYLSNHGGRQLDHAPSSVRVLRDIRLRCPEVFKLFDIYVDGGVMRGTDVVKALCLGARAVGIGRGFMYALSAYGTEGVLKAISILSDEIQTTMRLLGVTDLKQLNQSYIDLNDLESLTGRHQRIPSKI
ncbi:(S)-mandelate dehydrogenase [Colletotrichum sp. SAR 10_86]|nr:(S)-mandelate dehydrogenase [Colletotrichum sp. SAR 10_65]KAI8226359.1 (S)-mandelate dehydrogenase [Colletotrichum sp. SAR 10_86]